MDSVHLKVVIMYLGILAAVIAFLSSPGRTLRNLCSTVSDGDSWTEVSHVEESPQWAKTSSLSVIISLFVREHTVGPLCIESLPSVSQGAVLELEPVGREPVAQCRYKITCWVFISSLCLMEGECEH